MFIGMSKREVREAIESMKNVSGKYFETKHKIPNFILVGFEEDDSIWYLKFDKNTRRIVREERWC